MSEMFGDVDNQEHKKLLMTALRIAMSYIDGFASLKFINEILEIQKKNVNKYLTTPELFNYLYGVCYQSTIIDLSNILVYDKQTINIDYLSSLVINSSENNPLFVASKDLISSIRNVQEFYSQESDFYLGLKEMRDKYIAHVDKRRFHSPEGPTRKITVHQISSAYNIIGKLVGKLIGILALNPELLDFDQLEKTSLQFRLLTNSLNVD